MHGRHGEDPSEGFASADYPCPPVEHEPRIQELSDHDRVDGFPCLVMGKSDAQVICVDPALQHPNVSLVTPVNSALLLLRSANDRHPRGLANGSDAVGRYYMRHNNLALMAISREPNPTRFQKTLALNDCYLKADDWDYPLGGIQMLGKSDADQVRANARHWAGADGHNNVEALKRLRDKLQSMLSDLGMEVKPLRHSVYLHKGMPIGATAHQAGTVRFGTEPTTSLLDVNCKAHDLDNLYVVDTSFFPSIGAVNPSLTAIANALRVGDHLIERLG